MTKSTEFFRYVIRLGAIAGLALCLGASQASATPIDLTTAGSSAVLSADLGGTFGVIQISPQSTGSGVIDSFLRINSNRRRRGYNTNPNNVLDNVNGNFTHALLLSDVPIVTAPNGCSIGSSSWTSTRPARTRCSRSTSCRSSSRTATRETISP